MFLQSMFSLDVFYSQKVISIPPGKTVAINILCHVSNSVSITAEFDSGNTCLPGGLFVLSELLGITCISRSFCSSKKSC